jgi:hypothetical protein
MAAWVSALACASPQAIFITVTGFKKMTPIFLSACEYPTAIDKIVTG